MKVITFFNNKGGVGKTTLAVNIASYLKIHLNKRVLFIDADPQSNSTQMMIPEEEWITFYGEKAIQTTILDFLRPIQEGDSSLDFSGQPYSKTNNRFQVDLIPGHPKLFLIEDILSDSWNKCSSGDLGGFRRTNWVKSLSKHFYSDYDYIIFDVGPSLGALNRSILLNSDYFITPMGADIFSLMGIENIYAWMSKWINSYNAGITNLTMNHDPEQIKRYPLNLDLSQSCRFIGFSIQQYITKVIKGERRPVIAYENIIKNIPSYIGNNLKSLFLDGLDIKDLDLGDIPYLYSLTPLAQTNNSPIFELKRKDGVVGNQINQVSQYKEIIESICTKILRNIGEIR